MSKVYFAWVLVGARVNAQKWYGVPVTGTGTNKVDPLLLVELPEAEHDWPLDALKHKYPYEGAK
jgi:hypothetical protein